MLTPNTTHEWMNDNLDRDDLLRLEVPNVIYYPVSSEVGSVKNNHDSLIKPVDLLIEKYMSDNFYIISLSSHQDKRVVILNQGCGMRTFVGETIKLYVFKAIRYYVVNSFSFEVKIKEKY